MRITQHPLIAQGLYSEDFERGRPAEKNGEDVYSRPVRAGKRTYFFDVKATKGNHDFYLTITESKRRQERDGSFDKFAEGLAETVNYIRTNLLKDALPGSEEEESAAESEPEEF